MAEKTSLPELWHKLLTRLKNVHSSPHQLGKSFAIGLFLGILPGTGLAVALLVAIFLKLNKTFVTLGALVNNPFTTAFFYSTSYQVGNWLMEKRTAVNWEKFLSWHGFSFKELGTIVTPILLGSLVLGLMLSGAGYLLVYFLATQYQLKRKKIETSSH